MLNCKCAKYMQMHENTRKNVCERALLYKTIKTLKQFNQSGGRQQAQTAEHQQKWIAPTQPERNKDWMTVRVCMAVIDGKKGGVNGREREESHHYYF